MAHDNSSRQIVRKELRTAVIAGQGGGQGLEIKQIDLAPAVNRLAQPSLSVVGYVSSGTIRFLVDGEAQQTLSAGSAFSNPRIRRSHSSTTHRLRKPASTIRLPTFLNERYRLIEMLT
jgi:hypothetical protein